MIILWNVEETSFCSIEKVRGLGAILMVLTCLNVGRGHLLFQLMTVNCVSSGIVCPPPPPQSKLSQLSVGFSLNRHYDSVVLSVVLTTDEFTVILLPEQNFSTVMFSYFLRCANMQYYAIFKAHMLNTSSRSPGTRRPGHYKPECNHSGSLTDLPYLPSLLLLQQPSSSTAQMSALCRGYAFADRPFLGQFPRTLQHHWSEL